MLKPVARHLCIALAIAPLLLTQFPAKAETTTRAARACFYNPHAEQPNPLGREAAITFVEENGNTTIRFAQFPTSVQGERPGVTLAAIRELTFYGVDVDQVRTLLLEQPTYYARLLGQETPPEFNAFNDGIVCRALNPVDDPTAIQGEPMDDLAAIPSEETGMGGNAPPSGAPQSERARRGVAIASLPDGNYRFWSGETTNIAITDAELSQRGGVVFLFRKQGNRLTGIVEDLNGESMCFVALASGNTVAGFAYPTNRRITNTGEAFTDWDGQNLLRVRRGRSADNQTRYDSAMMDMTGFSRINAGSRIPPSRCP